MSCALFGTFLTIVFIACVGFLHLRARAKVLCSDRFGRKRILMVASFCMFAAMYTMAGLGVPSEQTDSMSSGIVAMVVVFGFSYNLGPAAVNNTICTEIAQIRLRDKTQRMGAM